MTVATTSDRRAHLAANGVIMDSMDSRTGGKQLIAHRGASAYAPEHSRSAYTLALEQRADFVEQDLAVTKDGLLICLHDDTLERTSNVTLVFPDRYTRGSFLRDRRRRWIAHDFTLDEIRTLDTGSWFDTRYRGERIVTFQDAIDLVRGRAGLYPELKSPALYRGRGVDVVTLFVEQVKRNGLDRPAPLNTTPMIVQSFDEATIRRLAIELPSVPRVLLLESFGLRAMSEAGLADIATFANGIGPRKSLVGRDPGLVRKAHAAGLTVTPWTFRSQGLKGYATVRDEMTHFLYALGVDALFTDNPDQFPR